MTTRLRSWLRARQSLSGGAATARERMPGRIGNVWIFEAGGLSSLAACLRALTWRQCVRS